MARLTWNTDSQQLEAVNDVVLTGFDVSHPTTSKQISKRKKKRSRDDIASDQLTVKERRHHKKTRTSPDVALQSRETLEPIASQKTKKRSSKRKKAGHREASDARSLHSPTTIDSHSEFHADEHAQTYSAFDAATALGISQTLQPHPQYMSSASYLPHDFNVHASPFPQYMFPQEYPQVPPFVRHPETNIALLDTLPDFAYGSNEDILRAIQSLDMTRIASVIKTLGDAAVAASGGPPIAVSHGEPQKGETSNVGQPSSLPRGSTGPLPPNRVHEKPTLPPTSALADVDHAHLLANKWMTANKLAELVKTQGLDYKKGRFSAFEEQQIRNAIERYRHQRQLSMDDLLEKVIFAGRSKAKDDDFWIEITNAVPLRPIIAVYHYVRRAYNPLGRQGDWKPENDAKLQDAVFRLGQQWEKVSAEVGRTASDCRDRYRNHIINREKRRSGPWSKEEENELINIVTEMTIKRGKNLDNDVFWGRVSERLGGKRGRQQCRIKWTDGLSKKFKNDGTMPRWSQRDAYILVHKIDSLNVRDDTEIDWKTLPDDAWNLWSAHCLQRRWYTLKRSVKGWEEMTHQEIMDILRLKKSQLPPPSPSKTKRPKSAAFVEATASDEESVSPASFPLGEGNSKSNDSAHLQSAALSAPDGDDDDDDV